jgi:hypothetical protein
MLVGHVGAGSDQLKSMHLVLLAFKSSWRPRKDVLYGIEARLDVC